MSIGGGASGGSHSEHSTSSQTTPWTTIANTLAGTLQKNLAGLSSGSNLTSWVKSISDSFKQTTKEGIAGIKSTFAGTGMAGSTDLARNISQFQTQQSTAEAGQISQVQQTNIQDQLAALSEIIGLASGSYSGTGATWGSQFGWNAQAAFGKH